MTSDTIHASLTRRVSASGWVGLLILIAALFLVAGCGSGSGQDAAPASGIGSALDYGGGWTGSGSSVRLPDRFSHDYHFRHFAAVDCALCHQSVHGTGAESFLPAPQVCLTCHARDMNEWAHQYHLDLGQGIVCLDCHGSDAATTVAESPVCLACHTRRTP